MAPTQSGVALVVDKEEIDEVVLDVVVDLVVDVVNEGVVVDGAAADTVVKPIRLTVRTGSENNRIVKDCQASVRTKKNDWS